MFAFDYDNSETFSVCGGSFVALVIIGCNIFNLASFYDAFRKSCDMFIVQQDLGPEN